MDLLIVEPLESEVVQWLSERYSVRYSPELARDLRGLRQALFNVRALVIPPTVALDAQALHYAPVLRAVGRVSAGAENIDLDACSRAGIEVVRSVTATNLAEAEFIVGTLLAMLRRVPILGGDGLLVGRELGAATIGLVGMAPAARTLAQLLGCFGTRVVGYDPALHGSDSVWDRWRVEPMGLRELLEECDGVCVQLSPFSRYHGLLGDRFLPHCKPNQVLVSLSHSAVVDENALADVLATGRMAAAWFDSLEPGTLDPGRPLYGIESLQVTPRLAGTTRESRVRAAWAVAKRIDELLAPAPNARSELSEMAPDVPVDLAGEPASP